MSAEPDGELCLGVPGFSFADLHDPLRLKDLHDEFWRFATSVSPQVNERFSRLGTEDISRPDQSEILIEVTGLVGQFVSRLFGIDDAVRRLAEETQTLEQIFRFRHEFLRTRVFRRFSEPAVTPSEFEVLDHRVRSFVAAVPAQDDPEVRFAVTVLALLAFEKAGETSSVEQQELAARICAASAGAAFSLDATLAQKVEAALRDLGDWCVQVNVSPERACLIQGWVSFIRPETLDYSQLVEIERQDEELPEVITGPESHRRARDGFHLTDHRMSRKEYLREIDYCILCHPREKDSCSHGLRDKTGSVQRNSLGVSLNGCPLEERISEMHLLRKRGEAIAALAMIMLDNPMCPGTGHRICNDCMKGCIYQKQDAVNIPQAETGIVSDVLALPWGFEIYSLLTRFNPASHRRPYALPYNGQDVLVVGLGPAGYTLAHYLANEGFGVVGIDGLKLEPVDDNLTGRGRPSAKPIRDASELKQDLTDRIVAGFGGVSEYGITVRWDKSFLAVMYLTLLRRRNTRFFGGVRFGGTLDLQDAWALGFQHVALATGAGKPTVIPMKNHLLRGIRTASDFLMALQLTGAFKKSSLASLQVRLPAIVIGGGLTAIDTATELLAYYPVQVEKALEQFETLTGALGSEQVWGMYDAEEKEILETFLNHGRAVRDERTKAGREGRAPNFAEMCNAWGGVSLVYRKSLADSPAYRLNHEEVEKALEEGIRFVENLVPVEAIPDSFGAVESVRFQRADGTETVLPARAVCFAAGTTPNTVYERESPGSILFDRDGKFFQKHRIVAEKDGWKLEAVHERSREAFFLSCEEDGRLVSFYGDNHPDFAGNVVKAMASAKFGARQVARLFWQDIERAQQLPVPIAKFETLANRLDEALVPRVVAVNRLTPKIVEVVVKAKFAAAKFRPGQFFRLQNYESHAKVISGTRLTLEGLALTGAWVDTERDLLGMVVLEMGVSSRLCAHLKPGEPVVVMGPTGRPSETPGGETVLLLGGGLGNAVLFSIGRELRNRGSKVLYFAGYKERADVFLQDAIEDATDQIVWAVDQGEAIVPRRPQDLSFVGNIVKAMVAYGSGTLEGPRTILLPDVDRILAIGSDRMMAAVAEARHGVLKPFLKESHAGIASINSMMQCMLKEVCGQCLQQHVNPVTKMPEKVVFSCFDQDQFMDAVDFVNLRQRLRTNSVSEKLTNRYLDVLLASESR